MGVVTPSAGWRWSPAIVLLLIAFSFQCFLIGFSGRALFTFEIAVVYSTMWRPPVTCRESPTRTQTMCSVLLYCCLLIIFTVSPLTFASSQDKFAQILEQNIQQFQPNVLLWILHLWWPLYMQWISQWAVSATVSMDGHFVVRIKSLTWTIQRLLTEDSSEGQQQLLASLQSSNTRQLDDVAPHTKRPFTPWLFPPANTMK